MTPLIQITNLSWRYSVGDWVLRDINLAINSGEKVGLVGRSGSGKSTLALTLNGLVPQSYAGELAGSVVVDGKDASTTPVSQMARVVSMVFQSPDDQMSQILTCHEIASGPANLGYPQEEVYRRADWAIDQLGIRHLVQRETATLSGGEKQKVALAAALAMQPKLLVLDEPTTDLDPSSKKEFIELVTKLDPELSVVIISHDTDVIAPLVRRLIILEAGTIIADDTAAELYARPDLFDKHAIALPQVAAFNHALRERHPVWPVMVDLNQTLAKLDHQIQYRPRAKPANPVSPQKPEPVIVLSGLTFSYEYGGKPVIDGLNLTIYRGEALALVGHNGSGKTTLSKLILRLLRPTAGKIVVLGKEVKRIQPDQVGYVYQNPDAMLSQFRVDEEVSFTPKSLGLPNWKARATETLHHFGLDKLTARFPLSLSKGQRQRLAFAAVTAALPPILIFDEPTTGIDGPTCAEIMAFMAILRGSGHTILFITHDISLALHWADRLAVMDKGRIVHLGEPDTFLSLPTKKLSQWGLELPPVLVLAKHLDVNRITSPAELAALIA